MSDTIFTETLACAIADWREADKTLAETMTNWKRLRAVILALSNQLGVDVPADVLASLDKRTVDVRRHIARAKSRTAEQSTGVA